MTTLITSKDRKVANGVTKSGKGAAISNTFGLPSGIEYSCPGMTPVCGSICYAGKIEKMFKGVRSAVLHNWELLKDADTDTAFSLIVEVIEEFVRVSTRKGAPLLYRIHWDGDFFSEAYTQAWAEVMFMYPQVRFWAYTRNVRAATTLHKAGLPNLSLYFSADDANATVAAMLHHTYGIRLAYLSDTFGESQGSLKGITGKPGAKCPEQTGQVDLISESGSACVTCGLCVFGKANISFSKTKR